MKKIIFVLLLSSYCHFSNAQQSKELLTSVSDSSDSTNHFNNLKQRIDRQEIEIEALKKDSESLKKEIKQSRSVFNSKRRVTVNRIGSKQVVVE